ncbi:Os09g0558250, partial [Oryza sativa Japonica Group]
MLLLNSACGWPEPAGPLSKPSMRAKNRHDGPAPAAAGPARAAAADSALYRFFMDSILFLHWLGVLAVLLPGFPVAAAFSMAQWADTSWAMSTQSLHLSLARFRSSHLASYASSSRTMPLSLHSSRFCGGAAAAANCAAS